MTTESKTNEQQILDALSSAFGQFHYASKEISNARLICKELPGGEKYANHLGQLWDVMVSLMGKNSEIIEDAMIAAGNAKKEG
jgi:hypothetical protein